MSETPRSIVNPSVSYPWPESLGPKPVKVDGKLSYVPAPKPETYAERVARLNTEEDSEPGERPDA